MLLLAAKVMLSEPCSLPRTINRQLRRLRRYKLTGKRIVGSPVLPLPRRHTRSPMSLTRRRHMHRGELHGLLAGNEIVTEWWWKQAGKVKQFTSSAIR